VAHTAGAIGYLALSVLDASVHVVAIDNQLPTAANISGGRYAFWGFEHMYTLGDNGGPVEAFLDYMLTSPIQRLAQQLGYIPISSAQLAASPPSISMLPLGATADVPRRVRGGT
jgi:phosphate transport system substrate-binding protein